MRILYHGPEQCFRLPSHNVAQEGRAGVGGGGGGGEGALAQFTNQKNSESRITEMKISFSRVTKISKK